MIIVSNTINEQLTQAYGGKSAGYPDIAYVNVTIPQQEEVTSEQAQDRPYQHANPPEHPEDVVYFNVNTIDKSIRMAEHFHKHIIWSEGLTITEARAITKLFNREDVIRTNDAMQATRFRTSVTDICQKIQESLNLPAHYADKARATIVSSYTQYMNNEVKCNAHKARYQKSSGSAYRATVAYHLSSGGIYLCRYGSSDP